MGGCHGRVAGGIAGVQRLLSEHSEAIEADLLRYFSVDLMDLWRGRLSYRRLSVLIRKLPGDSWTQTALRDAAETELVEPVAGPMRFGPWTLTNYQLAGLTDAVNALRYVTARLAGQDKYPLPEPTPRPGMSRPVRRQSRAAVAYLKKLRGRG